MRLFSFLRADPQADAAHRLHLAIVSQARQPAFYRNAGVPDTLDGRFELIVLHAFLLLQRLKAEGAAGAELGQRLFDLLFADMDQGLREMGVGDLGVGRRIKDMAKAMYGRIASYEAGLAGPDSVLAEALRRNLYGTVTAEEAHIERIAGYLRRQQQALSASRFEDLKQGNLKFEEFT